MVDVHCHLNFHAFEKDYEEVIKRAIGAGVTKIINVGTKIDSSKKAVQLAKNRENLFAIVGIHPHHADKLEKGWENQLERLAKDAKKVVGIGECGMDYYRYKSNDIVDPILQRRIFIKQIELAYKLKLPLQIHNRHAGKDILDILINHKSYLADPPGMFHCMSGDIDFLKKVLDLGFYVGFDGNITYRGKAIGETTDIKDLVRFAPLDRIVTETDSPFLTPEPYRGSRNMPEHVIIVGKYIAKIKGLTFGQFEDKTTINANQIFKFKVHS